MNIELKKRTKALGIRVLKMVKKVPPTKVNDILVRQIVRSATSVGANYRSALRARSTAEFISKISIAEEEADETCYWLELFIDIGIFPAAKLEQLLNEAREITAILMSCKKTAKQKIRENSKQLFNHRGATKEY